MTKPTEKKLILVVDDAPANLQIVRSILKDDFMIQISSRAAQRLWT